MATYKQPTALPTRKVAAVGISAALATLVVWAIQQFGGIEIPPGVEAALASVFSFIVGYATHDNQQV